MKKKILTLICGFVATLSASAQYNVPQTDRPPFGEEKFYVSSSLSGLDLNYHKGEKWNLDVQGKFGYLFMDNWMVMAQAEYDYRHCGSNTLMAGAGLRYYIEQNGLYLGLGANYLHQKSYDDYMPTAHLGYAFFLNRTVTIEPELYYNQSLKDSDYSGFGLRIGLGIYFE